MMERFSLSNFFLPISHGRFLRLVTEFRGAVEHSFGQDVKLDITALARPKLFQTWMDDDVSRWVDQKNKANEMLRTHDLSAITNQLWQRAGYVEVSILPAAPSDTAQYAHMEAKGHLPETVNFCVQSSEDEEAVRYHMLSQNPLMIGGNGLHSNRASRWASLLTLAH